MAEFLCKLGTPTGQIIERTYTADSEIALRKEFDAKDFLVFSIKRRAAAAGIFKIGKVRRKKVSAKEFLVFNQELASLLSAGMPIITSLDVLMERRKNPAFKSALQDIRDQVKSGASLSEAFESHGDLFPRIYASSLASGERSGEIAGVLQRYISYTKTMLALRHKVVSALTYPAILIVMSVLLIILLMTFVLPQFQGFFEDLGADMPLITRIVISSSTLLIDYWWLWVPLFVGTIVSVVVYKRTERGALAWDKYRLRLPLLGKLSTKYAISRFSRTLGTLVQGGIPLVSSLEIVARSVGNRLFEREIIKVARQVREGQPLSDSMEKTGLMTDMAIEMIKVGESTGALEEMLRNVATFYDDEIEADLATIVTLIEPVLLIFMALIVVTILLALYLPLLTSLSSAGV